MSTRTQRRYSEDFKVDAVRLVEELRILRCRGVETSGYRSQRAGPRWRPHASELPQRSGKLDRADERDAKLCLLRDAVPTPQIAKDI